MRGKKRKINLYSPSWLSREWLSEQVRRKMGWKKRRKSLHDQPSPIGSGTSTAQQLQYCRGTQVKEI